MPSYRSFAVKIGVDRCSLVTGKPYVLDARVQVLSCVIDPRQSVSDIRTPFVLMRFNTSRRNIPSHHFRISQTRGTCSRICHGAEIGLGFEVGCPLGRDVRIGIADRRWLMAPILWWSDLSPSSSHD